MSARSDGVDKYLEIAQQMEQWARDFSTDEDQEIFLGWARAVRELRAQSAWQPIETAPHEERVLLGWDQAGTWFCETGMASHGWRRGGISTMSRHGYATHWQPLPEGPRH